MATIPRLLRYFWAAPCSLLGLILALPILAVGGRGRWIGGALEIALLPADKPVSPVAAKLLEHSTVRAITFGHIIAGLSESELARWRHHEQIHVRQYEYWGPFFLIAYPLSSLIESLRGRHPYWYNRFERQAREQVCLRH